MSEDQKIRDDTSVKTKMQAQQDILLVANMKKKSLRVASDEAGKTDRFDKRTRHSLKLWGTTSSKISCRTTSARAKTRHICGSSAYRCLTPKTQPQI